MSNELTTFNFEITSLQQAMDYAKLIADSDLAPKDYKGKPGNVLVAIQYGVEIGLKPMQAIQNIAVINGRPSIWGDAMIALVQNNPLCEYIKEEIINGTAHCTAKRKGEDEHTKTFSIDDAKKAGLWGKQGPWTQYPERMLQLRARAFTLRDKFSDVLKGMAMREEVEDYNVTDISSRQSKPSAAKSHVMQLIQGKTTTDHAIDNVLTVIDSAKCLMDLTNIPAMVKDLSETDKAKARSAYKEKELKLKSIESEEINKETGEIEQKSPVTTEFDKIKKQLSMAKSRETLDIAADLINSVEEENRSELLEIYNQRKNEVK